MSPGARVHSVTPVAKPATGAQPPKPPADQLQGQSAEKLAAVEKARQDASRVLRESAAAVETNATYWHRRWLLYWVVYVLQVILGACMLAELEGVEYEALAIVSVWSVNVVAMLPVALPPSHAFSLHRPAELFALLAEEPGACDAVAGQQKRLVSHVWMHFPVFAAAGALTGVLLFDEARVVGPTWVKVANTAYFAVLLAMYAVSLVPMVRTRELAAVNWLTATEYMRCATKALLRRIEAGEEPYEKIMASVIRMRRLVELTRPHVFTGAMLGLIYPLSSFPAWIGCAVHPSPSGLLVYYVVFNGIFPMMLPFTPHAVQTNLETLPSALAYRAIVEEQRGAPEEAAKFHAASFRVGQMDLGWTVGNTKVTGKAVAVVRATILPLILSATYEASQGNTGWFWSAADLGLSV